MGCNCGGAKVAYMVTFANGSTQKYNSMAEAQAAIAKTGQREGATIRAVPR